MQDEHSGEHGHDGREVDERCGACDGQHLQRPVEREVGQHRGHDAQKHDGERKRRVRHRQHDGAQVVPVLEHGQHPERGGAHAAGDVRALKGGEAAGTGAAGHHVARAGKDRAEQDEKAEKAARADAGGVDGQHDHPRDGEDREHDLPPRGLFVQEDRPVDERAQRDERDHDAGKRRARELEAILLAGEVEHGLEQAGQQHGPELPRAKAHGEAPRQAQQVQQQECQCEAPEQQHERRAVVLRDARGEEREAPDEIRERGEPERARRREGAVQGDQPSFSVVKVRSTPSERQTIVPLRSVR